MIVDINKRIFQRRLDEPQGHIAGETRVGPGDRRVSPFSDPRSVASVRVSASVYPCLREVGEARPTPARTVFTPC